MSEFGEGGAESLSEFLGYEFLTSAPQLVPRKSSEAVVKASGARKLAGSIAGTGGGGGSWRIQRGKQCRGRREGPAEKAPGPVLTLPHCTGRSGRHRAAAGEERILADAGPCPGPRHRVWQPDPGIAGRVPGASNRRGRGPERPGS